MSDLISISLVAAMTAIVVAIILKPRKVLLASENPNFCGCKSCSLADTCTKFIGK